MEPNLFQLEFQLPGGKDEKEINFSSKVYSKSLLKVESLKRIGFCACVMRVSCVPHLQTIHAECLYSCK